MAPRLLQTAEDRRVDVVAAALAAFSAQGYFGTNTTEIARAAGISQAYLYRLYASKEAMFIAVLEEVKQRIRDDLDLALRSGAPDALEDVLMAQAVQGREEAAFLLQAVAACSVPTIAAAVRDCFADQRAHLRELGLRDAVIRDYFARAQFTTAVRLAAFPQGDDVARALTY